LASRRAVLRSGGLHEGEIASRERVRLQARGGKEPSPLGRRDRCFAAAPVLIAGSCFETVSRRSSDEPSQLPKWPRNAVGAGEESSVRQPTQPGVVLGGLVSRRTTAGQG
jgi:hypothetical protein